MESWEAILERQRASGRWDPPDSHLFHCPIGPYLENINLKMKLLRTSRWWPQGMNPQVSGLSEWRVLGSLSGCMLATLDLSSRNELSRWVIEPEGKRLWLDGLEPNHSRSLDTDCPSSFCFLSAALWIGFLLLSHYRLAFCLSVHVVKNQILWRFRTLVWIGFLRQLISWGSIY